MIDVVKIAPYHLKKNSLYEFIINPKTNTQIKTLARCTAMNKMNSPAERLGSIIFLKNTCEK
jgi:hypothetical protein